MTSAMGGLNAGELICTMLLTFALALAVRRGPSYWPALRLLALVISCRSFFWLLLRLVYSHHDLASFVSIVERPEWKAAYYLISFGGLLWVLWIVVRTNRRGREVDLLGRPADEAGNK